MGLLSDLYVSVPGEAARYDGEGGAIHCARLTRFTPTELSVLWAVLQGEEWDDRHLTGFERVFEKFGGVRTIHRVPDGFAHVAAALDPGDIEAIAQRWAATDELACGSAELKPALEEIVKLAGIARDSGQSLYLWNCR